MSQLQFIEEIKLRNQAKILYRNFFDFVEFKRGVENE